MIVFKNFLTRSKKFVGVDLGEEKIKVAVIEWNGKISIHGLSSADVPRGWHAQFDEEVDNNLIVALCQAADDAGVVNEEIVLAVGGNNVSLRHIKVPFMSNRELAKAIKWEVDRLFPDSSEKMVYHYLILGEIIDHKNKFYNVLLITVCKKLVLKCNHIFQASGLKLGVLDIPALALWKLYKEDNHENAALVHWDDGVIHLIVMKYNQIHFIRTLPQYDPQYLLQQIQFTLQYIKHTFPVPTVQKFILSGMFKEHPEFSCLIKEKTGIPVQFSAPTIFDNSQFTGSDFEVALGLALRGAM